MFGYNILFVFITLIGLNEYLPYALGITLDFTNICHYKNVLNVFQAYCLVFIPFQKQIQKIV